MANFGRFILVKKAGIEVGRVRYMNLRPHQHGTSLFHQFFPKKGKHCSFFTSWMGGR